MLFTAGKAEVLIDKLEAFVVQAEVSLINGTRMCIKSLMRDTGSKGSLTFCVSRDQLP